MYGEKQLSQCSTLILTDELIYLRDKVRQIDNLFRSYSFSLVNKINLPKIFLDMRFILFGIFLIYLLFLYCLKEAIYLKSPLYFFLMIFIIIIYIGVGLFISEYDKELKIKEMIKNFDHAIKLVEEFEMYDPCYIRETLLSCLDDFNKINSTGSIFYMAITMIKFE